MSQQLEVINKVLDEINKEGEPWEIGDQGAVVLNDAVVIVSMEEGRELKINVICGEPTRLDLNLGL